MCFEYLVNLRALDVALIFIEANIILFGYSRLNKNKNKAFIFISKFKRRIPIYQYEKVCMSWTRDSESKACTFLS